MIYGEGHLIDFCIPVRHRMVKKCKKLRKKYFEEKDEMEELREFDVCQRDLEYADTFRTADIFPRGW